MNEFIVTYYLSVILQFISLIFQFYGYLINVPDTLYTLKQALNVEFFVSIVEIIVYIWIGTSLNVYKDVMKKRYIDWFLTTNTLMISFSLLFIFFQENQNLIPKNDSHQPLQEYITTNITYLRPILLYNTLMLIIGYLGETKIIHKIYSVGIGFLFFFLSFYYLFHGFAKHTQIGKITISIIAIVWALYGVAHTFSDKWKNVCYNLLDLVSKNIFGVIIVFMLIHYKKLIPNNI